MAVVFDQIRSAFQIQLCQAVLFIAISVVFVSETQGAPEVLPICDEEQTSLYFNGKICDNGGRIDVNVGKLSSAWYCCSATPFDDVLVVGSAIMSDFSFNASFSCRNATEPPFDENNKGKPWILYSALGENDLSEKLAEGPMTYIWEDTIISGGNSLYVRRHECVLHLMLPNNGTTNTTPNTTGSSAQTLPDSSTVAATTTESSALTFYNINKLLLTVSFLALVLSLTN